MPLRLAVALDEGVPVWLAVEVTLAVALDEGVPVWLAVELRLAVLLEDAVPVWLLVELTLDVAVELTLDVSVPVLLDVAVSELLLDVSMPGLPGEPEGTAGLLLAECILLVALGETEEVGSERPAKRQGSATPPSVSDKGTAVWPLSFQPQHVSLPPDARAHVCAPPAATATWPVRTDAGTFA